MNKEGLQITITIHTFWPNFNERANWEYFSSSPTPFLIYLKIQTTKLKKFDIGHLTPILNSQSFLHKYSGKHTSISIVCSHIR